MSSQFIIYACPIGELAHQLEQYFDHSLRLCGRNTAHNYMPHCTLTGFFRDDETAIPVYLEAIAQSLRQASPPPDPVITITGMTFHPNWHGLELQSDWVKQLIQQVAQRVVSPTRAEPLRLKDWLHLSLAYEFAPEHAEKLTHLAQSYVDVRLPQRGNCFAPPVNWELRFYQRHFDQTWICHRAWSMVNGQWSVVNG
ncbi:hypothetical protein H6G89_24400 [Oscillatoria sp. FACHB-1407]|uniref:hypothetical protein n=1 Tax=Oscillatoria sp. FACHB-1407 TaxID=2692847 RepID=UPI00168796F2|nr:hypothetical protein [Oscillatoria sp. FACHB-1407]MBD2464147.1 hypothetical protein [Oscillatoria sp. FACHB-1407]